MKQQKYVNSLKKGSILWYVNVGYWDGKYHCTIDKYVVTTIQCSRGMGKFKSDTFEPTKYVNIRLHEVGVTVNKDGSWMKSIPETFKRKFEVGADLPIGLYTTQLQALKYAVYDAKKEIAYMEKLVADPSELEDWTEELHDAKIVSSMVKRKLTAFKKKANKK